MAQPGFFDVDERLAALSAAGDPLERLSAVVDFELFRSVLAAALVRSDRSRGGRPRTWCGAGGSWKRPEGQDQLTRDRVPLRGGSFAGAVTAISGRAGLIRLPEPAT